MLYIVYLYNIIVYISYTAILVYSDLFSTFYFVIHFYYLLIYFRVGYDKITT